MNINQVSFTEKELHCIARWLQNGFDITNEDCQGKHNFTMCWYCKYKHECMVDVKKENYTLHSKLFVTIFEKLQNATKVKLSDLLDVDFSTCEDVFLPASFQLDCPEMYKKDMKDLKFYSSSDFEQKVEELKKYRPIEYKHLLSLLASED